MKRTRKRPQRSAAAGKPRATESKSRAADGKSPAAKGKSRTKAVTMVRVANKLVPATSGHPIKKVVGASLKQLIRARKICLALPETTEKIAWGSPTFRVKDKLFAMFGDDHHADGRIALWCHAPKGAQVVLVESEPKRFFVPPYVGKGGWIGVILPAIDDTRLAQLVRDAYRMVAPKRLLEQLGE